MPDSRNRVFISYSHKNRKLFDEVRAQIQALDLDEDHIVIWDDTRIEKGDDWKESIARELETACVALVLVSPEFLRSRFIQKNELPVILRRAEQGGLRVFWLLLNACQYAKTGLDKFQAAHDIGKPLDKVRKPDRNQILSTLAGEIGKLLGPAPARSRLPEQRPGPEDLVFHDYEMHFTVYPNGYTLSHRKIDVEIPSPIKAITHQFEIYPTAAGLRRSYELPGWRDLKDAATRKPLPYPTTPFFAVGFPPKAFAFSTLRSGNGKREFALKPASSGRVKYQWMWGSPYMFDKATDYSWQLIRVTDRIVNRLRIVLRIHNHLKRPVDPAVAFVNPNVLIDLVDKGGRDLIYSRAEPIQQGTREFHPLFTCYHYEIDRIQPGRDIALLY